MDLRCPLRPIARSSGFVMLRIRAEPLAQLVLQVVDLALERHQFAFEPEHTAGQIGGRDRHDRGPFALLAEGHAHLVVGPPLYPGAEGLILAPDVELDNLGQRGILRDLELGPEFGEVAHQTVEARASLVEEDASLQEALLAHARAALLRGGPHRLGAPGLIAVWVETSN